MSDDAVELDPIDDPPKSGQWVDHESWFGNLTGEEIAEGNRLGAEIDPDDDYDNGVAPLAFHGADITEVVSYYDLALARAQRLREALLDHGVRAVSIELQTGRPGTPNGTWYDTRFVGHLAHHTVSRPSNGLTPTLALCKRGRTDVPGPLCNLYGGYDRISRILCMGWANHPGAGGPLNLGGVVIPRDGARPYLLGTEFEGGLEQWSDAMHEFMARHNAGVLDYLGVGVDRQGEHKTWAPDRKIDRLGYTTASGRQATARYLGTPATPSPTPAPPEDELTPEQARMLDELHRVWVRDKHRSRVPGSTYAGWSNEFLLNTDAHAFVTRQQVDALRKDVAGLRDLLNRLAGSGDAPEGS